MQIDNIVETLLWSIICIFDVFDHCTRIYKVTGRLLNKLLDCTPCRPVWVEGRMEGMFLLYSFKLVTKIDIDILMSVYIIRDVNEIDFLSHRIGGYLEEGLNVVFGTTGNEELEPPLHWQL